MAIAKYIGELLYDYECVIIPGLGGFISSDKSVSINEVVHSFTPPFRKIQFNTQLHENDGLLVNYIARQEKVDYKVAKQLVAKFVFECHYSLDAGNKKDIVGVGSIQYDENKNIVFEQNLSINYNSRSFGLSSLVSPSIKRESDEEKVKKIVLAAIDKNSARKKPIDRKNKETSKHRKLIARNSLVIGLVFILLTGGGYMYYQRDSIPYYYEKYASHIPFLHSSVNDYVTDNVNSEPVAKLSRSTASIIPLFVDNEKERSVVDETIAVEEDSKETNGQTVTNSAQLDIKSEVIDEGTEITTPVIDEIKMETNIPDDSEIIENAEPEIIIQPSLGRFLIIAGSFSKESNANRLVSVLRNDGYEALLADTSTNGMFRVAIMRLSDRQDAIEKLRAIRGKDYPDAWLLVK